MKVKTFTGATIDEALTAVKNQMGDSVLILETRSSIGEGRGGMPGRKVVEVIVADDDLGQASADPSAVLGIPGGDEDEDLLSQDEPNADPSSPFPEPIIRRPEELTRRDRRGTRAPTRRPAPQLTVSNEFADDPFIGHSHAGEIDSRARNGGLPYLAAESAAIPGHNAPPPAQLPVVLERIQELNSNGNGMFAPSGGPHAGNPMGYQPPQFARLSPGNVGFTAPAQPTLLEELPPARPEGVDPAWQRGPQNFSLEPARPRMDLPTPGAERAAPQSWSAKSPPEMEFKPSQAETATGTTSYPEAYQAFFEQLLEQDLPERMARSLIEYALRIQSTDAKPATIKGAIKVALSAVARTAPIPDRENPPSKKRKPAGSPKESDPWSILADDGLDSARMDAEANGGRSPSTPTIVAFVGTAGVGKTASLAKVAAHFANRKLRSVGLIGIETPQVGAVDQLQAYGELLGAPVRRVRSPGQLAEAIQEMRDRAYIFIDTPACSLRPVERKSGRSPFQPKHLKLFLEAVPGIRTHLVLNATTRERDARATVKTFKQIAVEALIFTRLDETNAFGHLLGLLQETSLPVSYTTSGREIPDDLEPATPEGLIARVLE